MCLDAGLLGCRAGMGESAKRVTSILCLLDCGPKRRSLTGNSLRFALCVTNDIFALAPCKRRIAGATGFVLSPGLSPGE